jgi:type I restriction enzyme M protein
VLNEADTRAKLIDPAAKAKEIEDAIYDLKAVNPHRKPDVDDRTPEDLMDIIEAKGREIAQALASLRVSGKTVR